MAGSKVRTMVVDEVSDAEEIGSSQGFDDAAIPDEASGRLYRKVSASAMVHLKDGDVDRLALKFKEPVGDEAGSRQLFTARNKQGVLLLSNVARARTINKHPVLADVVLDESSGSDVPRDEGDRRTIRHIAVDHEFLDPCLVTDEDIFQVRKMDDHVRLVPYKSRRKPVKSGRRRAAAAEITEVDDATTEVFVRDTANGKSNPSGIYSARRKSAGALLRRVSGAGYYLSGVDDKLDITGDWNAPFAQAARSARAGDKTLLDYDRLYTLWQAVGNVRRLSGAIVEVGVLRGGSTALMRQAGEHFGKVGPVYACDTFEGHVETDPALDANHTAGKFANKTSLAEVRAYLAPFETVRVLAGDIKETAARIETAQIDLIHLDVDVFEATRFVLDELTSRIPVGGMIVADDYAVATCPGVKLAVDAFVARSPDFSAMHLLTGQAVMTRIR